MEVEAALSRGTNGRLIGGVRKESVQGHGGSAQGAVCVKPSSQSIGQYTVNIYDVHSRERSFKIKINTERRKLASDTHPAIFPQASFLAFRGSVVSRTGQQHEEMSLQSHGG